MSGQPAYDGIAEWYDAIVERNGFQHWLVVPAVFGLTGDVDGRRILDLACGQGHVSRKLAERGARVVGIDISTRLLARARSYEAEHPLGIDYRHDDAQDPRTLAGEAFDGVVANMALISIPDLAAAVRTVRAALRPAGWFVFSITHPCFQSPGSARFTERDGRRGRAVYEYFDERAWRSSNPDGVRGRVDDYHRTLSTYVNTLVEHGLLIERIIEPRAVDPPQEQADYDVIPPALLARCVAT